MADTFFGFDTTIKNGDHLLPPDDDDCIENEEEEYDALNDETFGGLEGDSAVLDDWEQQHEQYAESVENSKHSEELENSISRLMLDDEETHESLSLLKNSVWAYPSPTKNGETPNRSNSAILSNLQKASKAFIESYQDVRTSDKGFMPTNTSSPTFRGTSQKGPQIRTLEEIEKSLIKTSNQQQQLQHKAVLPQLHHPPPKFHPHPAHHPMFQHPLHMPPRFPPGMNPQVLMPPMRPPHNLPPGLSLPGHPSHHHPHPFLQGGPMRHPGLMYPQGGGFPPNHPYNYPPGLQRGPQNAPQVQQQAQQHMNHMQRPSPLLHQHQQQLQQNQLNHQLQQNQHQQNHQQQQQRTRNDSYNSRQGRDDDEYAGLMSTREKQWLLNIQLLQLNTGTPYFDDYYYTVFKERKAKKVDNFSNQQRSMYPGANGGRTHRNSNSDRQHHHHGGGDSSNQSQNQTLTPRIYTPLQFENSLGKLQCGSVTAPRKIIDMDVVAPENGNASDVSTANTSASSTATVPIRDMRKTKQLLLELEALFALLLKAEDLRNPMAISNMEKLREIKQKQRLRELELAPTPEQKQEVLRLFKLESEPVIENQHDYISKIVSGFLQEDKFSSYLNIRKGKMLLLRLLPHLTLEHFSSQLAEIWSKVDFEEILPIAEGLMTGLPENFYMVLLSIPIIGRRDTSGDHILPKFHPFFKRYIQTCTMTDICYIVTLLAEVLRQQENSRSTPLSHQGKSPLYFVLLNKFGVSALVIMLIRSEYLISSGTSSEKQQSDWSSFLSSWAELTNVVSKVAAPIEPIPALIFEKHCKRFDSLTLEKRALLQKHFVDMSN